MLTGVLVALAWGVFGVEVGGKSVFGHARALTQKDFDSVLAEMKAELERRMDDEGHEPPAKRREAKAKKKAKKEKTSARDARVERLGAAAERVRPSKKRRAPSRRTKIDERISAKDHKALDDLLSARVQRRP